MSSSKPIGRCVRASDIADGLSQTVAMGEVLLVLPTEQRKRLIHFTPRSYELRETEEFIRVCLAIPNDGRRAVGFHGSWTESGLITTQYNHVLPPNSGGCLNGSLVQSGIMTAASEHSGGVHALLADGSVRWASDGIERSVGQAAGTVAGAEAAGNPF